MTQEEERLWIAKEQGDMQARERLIERFRHLAPVTRARLVPIVPPYIEIDDLVQEALLALIKAVDLFDRTKQKNFPPYAICSLRWAIQERLRQDDWQTRGARDWERRVQAADAALEAAGQVPDRAGRLQVMGLTEDEYDHHRSHYRGYAVLSLNTILNAGLDEETDLTGLANIPDPGALPLDRLLVSQDIALIRRGMAFLTDSERFVIHARYHEGLTPREIAQKLSLGLSRVSQIWTRAHRFLRAYCLGGPLAPG